MTISTDMIQAFKDGYEFSKKGQDGKIRAGLAAAFAAAAPAPTSPAITGEMIEAAVDEFTAQYNQPAPTNVRMARALTAALAAAPDADPLARIAEEPNALLFVTKEWAKDMGSLRERLSRIENAIWKDHPLDRIHESVEALERRLTYIENWREEEHLVEVEIAREIETLQPAPDAEDAAAQATVTATTGEAFDATAPLDADERGFLKDAAFTAAKERYGYDLAAAAFPPAGWEAIAVAVYEAAIPNYVRRIAELQAVIQPRVRTFQEVVAKDPNMSDADKAYWLTACHEEGLSAPDAEDAAFDKEFFQSVMDAMPPGGSCQHWDYRAAAQQATRLHSKAVELGLVKPKFPETDDELEQLAIEARNHAKAGWAITIEQTRLIIEYAAAWGGEEAP
jgi:hypothetical protein